MTHGQIIKKGHGWVDEILLKAMAPQDKVLFDKGELKIPLARPIYLVRLNECLLNDKIVIMMTWAKISSNYKNP